MPGMGHKSELRIGKEATFGAGATPSAKYELITWDVQPVLGTIQDPSLSNAVSRRGLYQSGRLVRGTFTVRLNYDGYLEIFRAVMGATGYTATLVGSETLVRDHLFNESSTLPSYELQAIVGQVPNATSALRILGAKFINLTITGTAGQGSEAMLQAEVTVLGRSIVGSFTATGTAAFPTPMPVIFHQSSVGGSVDDGTGDAVGSVRVRSFTVSYEQPHTEDRFYLGSLNMDEPLRSDFVKCQWRLTQEFTTETQFAAAMAFTEGSPKLVFEHPTTIGSSAKRQFELRSNRANLVEWSAPIQGYGVIISTATWEAFYDAADTSSMVIRTRSLDVALP